MTKVHTREKKKYGLGTYLNGQSIVRASKVKRPNRPQSYQHEDTAHKVAEAMGLKKGDYTLKKVKHNKRHEIIKN